MNQPQSPQQAQLGASWRWGKQPRARRPWEPSGHQARPGESKPESGSQPATPLPPLGPIQETAPTEMVPGTANFTPAQLLGRVDLHPAPFRAWNIAGFVRRACWSGWSRCGFGNVINKWRSNGGFSMELEFGGKKYFEKNCIYYCF